MNGTKIKITLTEQQRDEIVIGSLKDLIKTVYAPENPTIEDRRNLDFLLKTLKFYGGEFDMGDSFKPLPSYEDVFDAIDDALSHEAKNREGSYVFSRTVRYAKWRRLGEVRAALGIPYSKLEL